MKTLKIMSIMCVGATLVMTQIQASEENLYQVHKESAISSAAGTPWSASRQLELVKKAGGIRSQMSAQRISYPISDEDFKQIYQTANNQTIPFFAYSSMIDKESGAVKAISAEAAATQKGAIAFGIQRTFNREMAATTVEGGWGPLKRLNDLAILNVFEKEDAVLNGVVFQLPLADLQILSKREVGYDLIPVVVALWDDAMDEQKEPEILLAYTFQAPDYTGEGTRYTNPNVNPIPGYFNFLQKGLNLMGEDFKAMWWATTYLADKQTLVNELPYHIIDLAASEVR